MVRDSTYLVASDLMRLVEVQRIRILVLSTCNLSYNKLVVFVFVGVRETFF